MCPLSKQNLSIPFQELLWLIVTVGNCMYKMVVLIDKENAVLGVSFTQILKTQKKKISYDIFIVPLDHFTYRIGYCFNGQGCLFMRQTLEGKFGLLQRWRTPNSQLTWISSMLHTHF